MRPAIATVGHSTRDVEAFVTLLDALGIELLVDVRRFPGSRRLPQYEATALESALDARGIAYRWIPTLGGRRRPDPARLVGGRLSYEAAPDDHV